MTLQQVAWIAAAVGAMIAGVSTLLGYLTLRRHAESFRADHDRSKKALAVTLILQWNENTLAHRRAIEAAFPGLIDKRKDGGVVELTRAEATEIYHAKEGTKYWDLRFHIIELLNFLEAVAVASEHGVADRSLIERSFRGTLRNYYQALHNFMQVVEETRGYKPWEPYTVLIRRWDPQIPQLPPAPDERTARRP